MKSSVTTKTIIVFSQNLKIKSLNNLKDLVSEEREVVCLTTNELFDYEACEIRKIFGVDVVFITFADLMDDKELESCDIEAYSEQLENVYEYWNNVKKIKNERIAARLVGRFSDYEGYLLSDSDDLGICDEAWLNLGFIKKNVEFYHVEHVNAWAKIRKRASSIRWIKNLYHFIKPTHHNVKEVFESYYNGRKVIFIGSMNRIGYRMDIEFVPSATEAENLSKRVFYPASECLYLSTLHEEGKCNIPDNEKYDLRIIQDGYLPPNYSNLYLRYKANNAKYYAWDVLGERLFKNQGVPVDIMPFRKKLYFPSPRFADRIKKVLVATSGAGDWTALKNRSDDDRLIKIFVETAKRMPEVEFVYRCHPTWIHPQHAGVNSINRLAEYISRSNLPNLRLSSNIPIADENGFTLSFKRSSLKEDLKDADFVFGEHSASMLDAALDGIPFGSVNCTKRRDLAIGLTEMGFPNCRDADDVCELIDQYTQESFRENYRCAVRHYNEMTDME